MLDEKKVLESQLRECYGRVIYTHKTHEKCADILLSRQKSVKLTQIILSALVTGGLLTSIFDFPSLVAYKKCATFIGTILSTTLLIINSYIKDYDLGKIAEQHRQAASEIWFIREQYLSLLVDLKSGISNTSDVIIKRDQLLKDLRSIYTGAPSTNGKAYQEAWKALNKMEEMTFSDDEIDRFLPKNLRRNQNI